MLAFLTRVLTPRAPSVPADVDLVRADPAVVPSASGVASPARDELFLTLR